MTRPCLVVQHDERGLFVVDVITGIQGTGYDGRPQVVSANDGRGCGYGTGDLW